MHLRLMGFDARRVIRTRAVGGFEKEVVPDVEVYERGEIKYTFESKLRKNAFSAIYKIYEKERGAQRVYRFSMSSLGPYVAIGTDFSEVKKSQDVHFRNLVLTDSREIRTHNRIVKLRELLKGAQFLAIKDDGKPILFIRYWA